MNWRCRNHSFDLSQQGEIMGILNITPDSFSDGGKFASTDRAVEQALAMLRDGAAIIDIGGESTRPGAARVDEDEEKRRVLPVIEAILEQAPAACLSIDTSKPNVAREAIAAGAAIINDVTGFTNEAMIEVAVETGAGLVVMHMQGTPESMQEAPFYNDVVEDVRAFFQCQYDKLTTAGVAADAIVFDPGIGFGKTLTHNLQLLNDLKALTVADRPLLLGVSRKSFIGALIRSEKIEDRNWPTVALTSNAREQGVPLHRVHEVRPNLEGLRMMEAMVNSSRA